MHSHSHLFIPTTKKDVQYCKICSSLSYKGIFSKSLSIKSNNRFNVDPLKMKFKPISSVCNYKLINHIKYLENKNRAILKIKFLVNCFGLKSMIFYKSICLMNQIFFENNISLDSINDIDSISSICVLLVAEYNECCIPSILEEKLTKDEIDILYHFHNKNKEKNVHKSNLRGLFCYIKSNVFNYKYWEVLCLKYLNYDLGRYSTYDYLILFFKLGIFFCEENINIIDRLKFCINILDLIIYDKKFCDFSQYTFAMSIIKVVFENDNFFDKKIFKYIYGVDLSKNKYIECSNLIKTILNVYINNEYSRCYFNILNNVLYFYQLKNQIAYNNKINEKGLQFKNNNNEEKKNDDKNYEDYKDIICKYNKHLKTLIVNNNHIIINNDNNSNNKNFINCNNNNFNYYGNNYYFLNINNNNLANNCNKNYQ